MLAVFASSELALGQSENSDSAKLVGALIERWQDFDRKLQSATLEGSIVESQQLQNDEQAMITSRSQLQGWYSRPKFLLQLTTEFRKTNTGNNTWQTTGPRRDTVCFDGSKLILINHVDGKTSGTIFFDFSQAAVLRGVGYPFADPVQLWHKAFQPSRVDPNRTSLTSLGSGGVRGSIDYGRYTTHFYLLGAETAELRRIASYRPNQALPFRETVLEWEHDGDASYVNRFSSVQRIATNANADTAPAERIEVHFSKFNANVPIESERFEMANLEIPANTQFEDRRANTNGKAAQFLWTGDELIPLE